MPRQNPAAFRQALVDRMLAGKSVVSLVADIGVPEQTLHRWKTQGRVDAGLADGVTSTESQALRDAHRQIKELEDELAPVNARSEIYDFQAVVDPIDGKPSWSNSPRAAIRFSRQPEPQAFPDRPSPIAPGFDLPQTARFADCC